MKNQPNNNEVSARIALHTVLWSAVLLLLSGCIGQLPEDSNGATTDTVLAGDIERESRLRFSGNVVRAAIWDGSTGVLTIQGLGELDDDDDLSVFNATTRQILLPTNQRFALRALGEDDDDNWNLRLTNLAAVPCSISVSTERGVQRVPVLNAPLNCSGVALSAFGAVDISKAKWKESSNRLTVKGGGALPNQVVSVFDTATGQFLGSDTANSVGNWRVRVRNLFPVPCSVSASVGSSVVSQVVEDRPLNCSGTLGGVPGSIGTFPGFFPGVSPLFGAPPEGVIQAPLADLNIPVGTSINFIGFGFDPDPVDGQQSSVSYRWSFGGSALLPDRFEQSPDVLFTQPGIYFVTLTVTDATGLSDPTPATRLVVVSDANAPIGGGFPGLNTPEGIITEPAQQGNIVVSPGQALNFAAASVDQSRLLSYHWNFGGAAPNMVGQFPGPVVFFTPGTYLVSLVAMDAVTGQVDPTPDYRTVTVLGTTSGFNPGNPNPGFNQAPSGKIVTPLADQSIPLGGSINFSASGYDPDNNAPLSYSWNFGGAATPSNLQNPGLVTFNIPGTYYVTMTVRDNLGAVDPTPETRRITVGVSGGNTGAVFNSKPVINNMQPAQDMSVNAGQPVNFAANATDADGDTQLIYSWDFDGAMADSLVQNPGELSFTQAGTYRVRLRVTDSQGAVSDPMTRTITVIGSSSGGFFNQEPNGVIIDPAVNMTISAGQSISFSGLATDPDGDIVSYSWDFDGQAADVNAQVTPPITFSRAGSYRVTLNVRDSRGGRDSTPDMRVVTVVGGSFGTQAPMASIVSPVTDVVINTGDTLNFAASTAGATTTVSYNWNFGNATAVGSFNSPNPGAVTFNQPGVYPVTLTVSNGLATDTVVRNITVVDAFGIRPVASITAPFGGQNNLAVGQELQFAATASGGIAPYTYMWDFDGAAADSDQQNAIVRFNRAGTYSIKVFAIDAMGNRSQASSPLNLIVGGGAGFSTLTPQILMTPANASVIRVGQTINFSGIIAGSSFAQGVTYRWNFDGAAPSVVAQNPGNVTFNRVGTYNIRLTATDQNGTSMPVVRTLTVAANGGFFGGPGAGTGTGGVPGLINATISNPINNGQTLSCGVPFNFAAMPLGTTGVNYKWSFYQGNSPILERTGSEALNVTFNSPGAYSVALTATTISGGSDATPDIRTFNVLSSGACTGAAPVAFSTGSGTGGNGGGFGGGVGGAATTAPNGNITSPVSDVTMRVGQSQSFTAESYDPSNSGNVTYRWDFGNLPATGLNVTAQNAGSLVFNQTGVFVIRFTVTNASGISDPTPSIRVITVLP